MEPMARSRAWSSSRDVCNLDPSEKGLFGRVGHLENFIFVNRTTRLRLREFLAKFQRIVGPLKNYETLKYFDRGFTR